MVQLFHCSIWYVTKLMRSTFLIEKYAPNSADQKTKLGNKEVMFFNFQTGELSLLKLSLIFEDGFWKVY